MITIQTEQIVTGNAISKMRTVITGTVSWSANDYYGNILASVSSLGGATNITLGKNILEEIGATFWYDGLQNLRFRNSGSGELNYTIIYPLFYLWNGQASEFNLRLTDFWLNNTGSNIYPHYIYSLPTRTNAYYNAILQYQDMAEYQKENNAIVVYNYLRKRNNNQWSLSSVACLCAIMDCAMGFNGASGRIQTSLESGNDYTPYGYNFPETNYFEYPEIDPYFIPTMKPSQTNNPYRGCCGLPYIGLQYFSNLQLLYGDNYLYRDDIFTLESVLALWNYEYLFNPNYDMQGSPIWIGTGEGHKPLQYFVTSDDEPEELATLMFLCLNRNGKVKYTTPLYGTEDTDNTTDYLNSTYSLQCLMEKARKWYDFLKQFEPKRKKHKMPLWEYLRYTI